MFEPTRHSIINLFNGMDSNLTKYYSSKKNQITTTCTCLNTQQLQLQTSFYQNQADLVHSASTKINPQDHHHIKLLSFMHAYLLKIICLLQAPKTCSCKQLIIDQSYDDKHKISFLRDQNNKFFKLIQEKSQQCELLKSKLSQITNTKSKLSLLSDEPSSRICSVANSRVTELLRCPENTQTFEKTHGKYFGETKEVKRNPLLPKNTIDNTFSKIKLFQQ